MPESRNKRKSCDSSRGKGGEVSKLVPEYLERHVRNNDKIPPGHMFWLYLDKIDDKGKRKAFDEIARKNASFSRMLEGLINRQETLALSSPSVLAFHVKTCSPLTIGLGNPHPLENGFSFLSPYGLPYLPGSGIKGAVRRSAEELALFDEHSLWSIPLVWLLFGIDSKSAYLNPSSPNKYAEAFSVWFKEKADGDEVLKSWLECMKHQIPNIKTPKTFCESLQWDNTLRNSISWQGLLNFWDVFPRCPESSAQRLLEVDITNPHHKEYLQDGTKPPVETESPVPVFFLVIPPEAELFICVEKHPRIEKIPALKQMNIDGLLKEAVENCIKWIGFGAKTSLGYGMGEYNDNAAKSYEKKRHLIQQEKERLEEEARKEKELAQLPEDLAWLRRKEPRSKEELNNIAQLLDEFLEKFPKPGDEALNLAAEWLQRKYPKILDDPDATSGKKNTPKYKEIPRKVAKKLLALQEERKNNRGEEG